MLLEEAYSASTQNLGHCGRMLSGSKSDYLRRYPNNVAVFNSNICTKSHGKIWFGDLDITKDAAKLQKLAVALDEDVYVLREHDGRFENETAPKLDRAVAIVSASEVKYCNA